MNSPSGESPNRPNWNAPHVFANLNLLNRHESDPALEAAYVPEWKKEGLDYKDLGDGHPWCSVKDNADKRKVGVKGTDHAGAASHRKWGRQCPYWFGATLGLNHASGGDHVTTFLYWIDEKKKLAACYGGNQQNRLCVAVYNLSGNAFGHDEVIGGPRWSKDIPDGFFVSKEEVLKHYPQLIPYGTGGSTR